MSPLEICPTARLVGHFKKHSGTTELLPLITHTQRLSPISCLQLHATHSFDTNKPLSATPNNKLHIQHINMSGTSEAYHLTKEDVRKVQQQESKAHGGDIPADSAAAGLQVSPLTIQCLKQSSNISQSVVDNADKNKSEIIAERQANLPLPDQPPTSSDFSSADARTVNVGSGEQPTGGFSHGQDALRGPATGDSAVRTDGISNKTNTLGQGVGREAAEGLGGIPNDAVAQGSKNKSSLEDTTGKDYGYPQKNDPSSGISK